LSERARTVLAIAAATGGLCLATLVSTKKRERSLRAFVEDTAHDLRLPLTVLFAHLSDLRDQIAAGAAPDRRAVREAMEESLDLASLVENLAAAARLGTGRPIARRTAFSWNRVLERVIARHGPIAREREIELSSATPERDVLALGDATLVEQALSNLVHNAVRYNRPGGHVAVTVETAEGRFVVRVIDDGPGVPDEELARVARRAYRSRSARARHPEGEGLGLSIANEIAVRHAFELALSNASPNGLEVAIRGPLSG